MLNKIHVNYWINSHFLTEGILGDITKEISKGITKEICKEIDEHFSKALLKKNFRSLQSYWQQKKKKSKKLLTIVNKGILKYIVKVFFYANNLINLKINRRKIFPNTLPKEFIKNFPNKISRNSKCSKYLPKPSSYSCFVKLSCRSCCGSSFSSMSRIFIFQKCLQNFLRSSSRFSRSYSEDLRSAVTSYSNYFSICSRNYSTISCGKSSNSFIENFRR